MGDTIVLYPSPGIGHLIAMVELGKCFLQLNAPFSITILITQVSFNTGSTAPYIQRIKSNFPSISFLYLPTISLPLDSSPSPYREALTIRLLQLNNPLIHQSLLSISQSATIRALVFDFFCCPVLHITSQLHIPSYCFFTSGASCLAIYLYLPTLHSVTHESFKDLQDTQFHVPGVPPIPALAMPTVILDRGDEAYDMFFDIFREMPKSSGILVNSFSSLEPGTMKVLSEGACVTDGPTPAVYCIGPLIADEKGEGGRECLEWLDSQPSRSVVFLCFGSLGVFSAAQLKEIAVGLERSGQRFLWVVRRPPSEDKSRRFLSPPEPDLDVLLPQGFLERTKERGMVVKSWASQVAVLGRDSVAGFVTHCGWNSVLESLCAGVPMVAWPLYAEQMLNRVILVEELKLAMPMDGAEKGWVEAKEVEKRVRGLMESEAGKALRERTVATKHKAWEALSEGGSSRSAMTELVHLWMRG